MYLFTRAFKLDRLATLATLVMLCSSGSFAIAEAGTLESSDSLRTDSINQVNERGRRTGWWRIIAPVPKKSGYKMGQLVEEGTYENSRRVGIWTCYWPEGGVKSKINYVAGRPNGEYTIYYKNGQIEEQGTWTNERNVGGFKRYHPNGNVSQDFSFTEHGLRDGVQKYYHENGQLAVQVEIHDGKEDGELKRWYANGDLQQVAEFNGGVINAENSKYLKPVKKEVKPEPPAEPAVEAPKVTEKEAPNEAIAFRRNGHNTLYDEQRRITQIGVFRDGKLWNGKYYRYTKNGHLARIEMFIGGKYAGLGVIEGDDLKLVAP